MAPDSADRTTWPGKIAPRLGNTSLEAAPHLHAVQRTVTGSERDGRPSRTVALSRTYATSVDDSWNAVTSAERIARWFLPVSGELVLGGRYQLEGNAGGTITACEPPSHLALTWEFAGDVSWVEVDVADAGARRARLMLTHVFHHSPHYAEYGPGATGIGWELGLMGLAIHLEHPEEPMFDEAELVASPEGKAFISGSSNGWAQAAIENGENADAARAAAERSAAFYGGEPAEPA